ncbi:MAG: response regulator [Microcoleaceae cyanobacterium]
MRFLVVEDDEAQAHIIKTALIEYGYVVDVACDGAEGWSYIEAFTYDLILLNVSLPTLDGISLCRRLRTEGYNIPVLLLTANSSSIGQVAGLAAGADDYIVKPCSIAELFARVRALLRRPINSGSPVLTWNHLKLDPSSHEVTYQQQLLSLSPKEYSLLELFLRNPKRVLTRNAILEHLWSFEALPGEDTIRAHIKRLRRKLKTHGIEEMIETVYGIGYRLKPTSSSSSSSDSKAAQLHLTTTSEDNPLTTAPAQSELTAMTAAWERFRPKIQDRVRKLEQLIEALHNAEATDVLYQQAEASAHKLAGSLGMFGLESGYQLAKKIEQSMIAAQTEADFNSHISTALEPLPGWMKQLHQSLKQPPNLPPSASIPTTSTPTQTSTPLMLIVDDDAELTELLQIEALDWNIRVLVALDLNQARAILLQVEPDIVLLDLAFPNLPQGGLILLEEIKAQFPKLQVLVFSAQEQVSNSPMERLRQRAAVAKLGGNAFLPKSVPASQVLEAVLDLLQPKPRRSTILALDDDVIILDLLSGFLSSWGLSVTTLSDPCQFWQTLKAVKPDLLILDLDMPHFNGIELCRMVRNDQIWQGLPILFLSASQDPEITRQIYQVGADDYISKPFNEAELATRIFNRLERVQLWRSLAEVDALTGLANRRRSIQDLNRYLRLAQRHHQSFCIGLLDIDRFRQVNDFYSAEVGDRVLRQLGQLLLQQFRGEDIVARWSGEEFLIGWYGMSKANGVKRMQQLLELIRLQIFQIPHNIQLQITASAGITTYPEDGQDLSTLYRQVETALHQAKSQGRDRLVAIEGFFAPQDLH